MVQSLNVVLQLLLFNSLNLFFDTLKDQAGKEYISGYYKSIAYYDICILINSSDPSIGAASNRINNIK